MLLVAASVWQRTKWTCVIGSSVCMTEDQVDLCYWLQRLYDRGPSGPLLLVAVSVWQRTKWTCVIGCSVCMTEDQVDLWIVHRGGLFVDLFVGYFLFFDLTRPVGFLIAFTFNSMNSQIFSIGTPFNSMNSQIFSIGTPFYTFYHCLLIYVWCAF